MTIYPIEYRTIQTQYAFLVQKNDDGTCTVDISATCSTPELFDVLPKMEARGTHTFKNEKAARQFINSKQFV